MVFAALNVIGECWKSNSISRAFLAQKFFHVSTEVSNMTTLTRFDRISQTDIWVFERGERNILLVFVFI